ncbi:MAG: NHL repeat-containing protein [bacterium]
MIKYSCLEVPFLLFLLLMLSCKSLNKNELSESQPAQVPQALIVEEVISGKILGDILQNPIGLAVDSRGVMYCIDEGNKRVIQFGSDHIPLREFGGPGAASGLFGKPSYITVDNDLNLIISDEGNQRLSRYNSKLNFVDEYPFYDSDDPLKFGYPSGVGITNYGELWVADYERNRIAVFDNVGNFDKFVGDFGYTGQQLKAPRKIITDKKKQFIVCDAGNSRLIIYDEYGNFIRAVDNGEFVSPTAAFVDSDGIWVIDGKIGRLFFLNNKYETVFSAGPILPGTDIKLNEPSDIVMLPDKKIVISDTGNDRLLVCRVIYN